MSVSEEDLMLLESYLDNQLAWDEIDQLRNRLAVETELAEALTKLRNQRELRKGVFHQADPSDQQVDQLIHSIKRDIRQEQLQEKIYGAMRWVASAAAMLLIGFAVGRQYAPQQVIVQQPANPGITLAPVARSVVPFNPAVPQDPTLVSRDTLQNPNAGGNIVPFAPKDLTPWQRPAGGDRDIQFVEKQY